MALYRDASAINIVMEIFLLILVNQVIYLSLTGRAKHHITVLPVKYESRSIIYIYIADI